MTTQKTVEGKIRVLYLDDEDNNLRAFKASFRRDYQIFTANNSEDAFRIVKQENPHVIFSDQRMPVTTGVEFFNAVRQVFPEPIRILITGFTDVNDIIDAINKGHIYRYITKPWSEAEIKVAIENAYDLYKTKRELQAKMADLEKTNDELNRFIYSTSHDLRSPLATVLGLVRVARLEIEEAQALDYFSKIEQSVQRLDLLVNHIIDYYRNSKAEDHQSQIKFTELVDDILETLNSDRGKQDALLEVTVNEEAPLFADEFRLRIILSHLITNAIKFKRPDQDKARVKLTYNCNKDLAEIRVTDSGIGILQTHLNQIFRMFFKTQDRESGPGIGLYIVKEALQKMGGEIVVQSEPNEGTEFTIQIPNNPT